MPFSLLYVTHPSKPEVDRITIDLLNQCLIACANYFPIESVYNWKGSIAREQEIMTIYKTSTINVEKVRAYIEAHHKYEIPCIIKLTEVSANVSYENWIYSESTKSISCENL